MTEACAMSVIRARQLCHVRGRRPEHCCSRELLDAGVPGAAAALGWGSAGNRISAIRLWHAAGPRPAADFGAAMRFPATVRVAPLATFACTAVFCPMSEISVTKSHERDGGRDTL